MSEETRKILKELEVGTTYSGVDVICRQYKEIERLNYKLQQKENIIKEAKKYIKEHSTTIDFKTMRADHNLNMNELLEILGGRK